MVARLVFALLFAGLGLVALLYALANAPRTSPANSAPILFAWTATETACRADAAACEAPALIAQARAAPLSHQPFLARLSQDAAAAEAPGLEKIAGLVLARDPRSLPARGVLAQAAWTRGDKPGFLALLLPLFDLEPGRRAEYADLLASLSADDDIRAAISARLEQAPAWRHAYLAAVTARGGLSASQLIPLYRSVPAAQAGFLARLTRQGDWDVAYVAFSDFLAASTGPDPLPLTVPFNPQLRDHPAPAPFNWSRVSRRAQVQPGGGVYLYFEGRKPETILLQSFPLPQGSYRLEAELSGDASENGGSFRWQVACAAGGPPIARLDLGALKAAPFQQAWSFDLPEGRCAFVTLSLHGVPGTFPQPARMELRSVRLTREAAVEAAP